MGYFADENPVADRVLYPQDGRAGALALFSFQMVGEREKQAVRRRAELSHGVLECVYLTSFDSESSFLTTVLQYSRIRVRHAGSLEEADFLLTVTGATTFLVDTTFLDGTWYDALEMVSDFHPMSASLIVADPVDQRFVADGYERGALGVLWRPFDFTRAIRWIRTADQAIRERALWLAEAT